MWTSTKYSFKNGKNCCSVNAAQCPSCRAKNSQKVSGSNHHNWGQSIPQHVKDAMVAGRKHDPWNKGLSTDNDFRVRKGSEKFKGFKHSSETRNRLSELKKGTYTAEENPNWKGGVTELNYNERFSAEYQESCANSKKRDNYTCQCCGLRDEVAGQLQSHHIDDFSRNAKTRLAIENLTTLCSKCHREFHIWNGGFDKPCNSSLLATFINIRGALV